MCLMSAGGVGGGHRGWQALVVCHYWGAARLAQRLLHWFAGLSGVTA